MSIIYHAETAHVKTFLRNFCTNYFGPTLVYRLNANRVRGFDKRGAIQEVMRGTYMVSHATENVKRHQNVGLLPRPVVCLHTLYQRLNAILSKQNELQQLFGPPRDDVGPPSVELLRTTAT